MALKDCIERYIKETANKKHVYSPCHRRNVLLNYAKVFPWITPATIEVYVTAHVKWNTSKKLHKITLTDFFLWLQEETKDIKKHLANVVKGEVYVDENSVLRLKFSGVPALCCHARALKGIFPHNVEETIKARKEYRKERSKVIDFWPVSLDVPV